MKNKLIKGAIVVVVIAVLIALAYMYKRSEDGLSDGNGVVEGDVKSGEVDSSGINPINTDLDVPAPNLNSKIIFSSDLSEEAKNIFEQKIEETRGYLRKDSNLVNDWIVLGTYYKAVEDFDKAVGAWEYASLLQPTNNVPFQNLADLYGYHLKDVDTAERFFLKAIEVDPYNPYLYVKTGEFYSDFFDGNTKAKNILNKGLEKVPDSKEIKEALDNL